MTLLNDIIFKIVFGTEQSRPVLRALLNALLGLTGDRRVVDLEILNPYLDKEHMLDRGVILDVKARDGRGRLYNIEVQVSSGPAYIERVVYYLARMFGGQLEPGVPYTSLAKTIGISLLDFVLFKDFEDLHSLYRLRDSAHDRELTDILELHFIELAKFRRNKAHELRTPFEKWLHLLKFGELYENASTPVPGPLKEEEGIEMAIESMRKASASDEVRELVELRRKALSDEATRLEAALKQGLQQGLEQGLEQGREQGLEQGLEQGREQGLEQGREQAAADIARNLLRAGLSVDAVVSATGLSSEELEKLATSD